MNTAEYIVKKLEELGINDFFGLPGDYNFNILDAISNNSNTNWIGCTNELNAGYAADGYARIKGYGALVTTYGVGELSAVNAIAGAYAENIPIVHIVGMPATENINAKEMLHHNFQNVDYTRFQQIYKNITAASTFLTRDNAKMEIDRVLKILVKEKKPVYIAIPSDIANLNINDREVIYDWISDRDTLKKAANAIIEKISKSNKPIIIGDSLVKRFDASIEFKEFCEKSRIPTTNLLTAIDIIDQDNEKYIGNITNQSTKEYLIDADCVLFVGTICSDLNTFGVLSELNFENQININGTCTFVNGKKYDNIKMSDVLDEISKQIQPKEIYFERKLGYYEHKATEQAKLSSNYIYPRLQEFFKENDIIFVETGTAALGLSQTKLSNNIKTELQSLWCSIGWATPAAFGASIARPQSRTILITGDGAHQCSSIEIGNMLRHNQHTIVVLISNNGYTMERILSNNPNQKFNDILSMNYAKFGRAFEGDIWTTKAETDEDFDKALKVTQIMNKMCYIEACTAPLDAPAVLRGNLDSTEETKESTIEPEISPTETSYNFEDIELTTSTASNEYETVVHQSIEEDEE